jgi:hypothetical protein
VRYVTTVHIQKDLDEVYLSSQTQRDFIDGVEERGKRMMRLSYRNIIVGSVHI